MSDITDLNVFVGPPRKVKIGPKVYELPRDIAAEIYLEIIELQQRGDDLDDDDKLVRQLRDEILELFQVHQPDMTRLPAAVSIPLLVQMIGRVYGDDEPEETTGPPPRSSSPGKSRTTAKPRATRSRSSKS